MRLPAVYRSESVGDGVATRNDYELIGMTKRQIVKKLIDYISASPTQFHAVESLANTLRENGFTELREKDCWNLKKGGKYYIVRGGTAIIAFRMGKGDLAREGFHIVGAHSDSPGLKIKANPENKFKGYLTLGVEAYGGAILSTWFDRDLSIAGRVSYLGKGGKLDSVLIDFGRPLAIIPNLAIHLNPKTNENRTINKQKELPPILLQFDEKGKRTPVFKELLKTEMNKTLKATTIKEILDYDLWLYDTQTPSPIGYNREFVIGARLDNLLSCFLGMQALIEADSDITSVLICNDNEEVGSSSFTGAGGPFLKTALERIAKDRETLLRAVSQSILISADNAHGIHPNHPALHDENHGPILNLGPVVKINANQRYATNSETGAFFRLICHRAKIPTQDFINRSDLSCGSTIGPITATNLGIRTLDIGAPTFAMHSIRETCGAKDVWYLYQALKEFFGSVLQPTDSE